ncbi:hypothetical protein LPJ73_007860, partial [Coemansia sp. RSA 2703]
GINPNTYKISGDSQTPSKRTRSSRANATSSRPSKRQRSSDTQPQTTSASSSGGNSSNTTGAPDLAMTLPLDNHSANSNGYSSPTLQPNNAHLSNGEGEGSNSSNDAAAGGSTASGDNSNSSSNGLCRYPGQPQQTSRNCLRDSPYSEEQVVRLIMQELHDRGFVDTLTLLQKESGFTLEDEPIARFRASILAGEWDQVKDALLSIGLSSEENKN